MGESEHRSVLQFSLERMVVVVLDFTALCGLPGMPGDGIRPFKDFEGEFLRALHGLLDLQLPFRARAS